MITFDKGRCCCDGGSSRSRSSTSLFSSSLSSSSNSDLSSSSGLSSKLSGSSSRGRRTDEYGCFGGTNMLPEELFVDVLNSGPSISCPIQEMYGLAIHIPHVNPILDIGLYRFELYYSDPTGYFNWVGDIYMCRFFNGIPPLNVAGWEPYSATISAYRDGGFARSLAVTSPGVNQTLRVLQLNPVYIEVDLIGWLDGWPTPWDPVVFTKVLLYE